ncbi:heterokaryon incompatibility protein-domain-containing protein [Xylariales sp. AK1849]|nr:heterokaryon incompatibility protein-domain-containing protein [Xylariales sp. AK1849]
MASINGDQIRVLDILPGEEGSLIRCERRVVSLSAGPRYEALSYVWGDQTDLVDIELSGRVFAVTRNLYVALCRLRLRSDVRPVWIDQLCIEQKDYEEKSTQVRLMRQIYSQCSSGLIWLGELREDISERDAADVVEYMDYLDALMSGGSENLTKPIFTSCKTDFERFLTSLKSMSRRECPWWTRIWTVQEAILPRKAMLLWGPFQVSWDIFLRGARTFTFKSFQETDIACDLNFEEQWAMFDIFRWVKPLADVKDQAPDPIRIMTRWRGRLATDPCDKVYALSGLNQAGTLPSSEACDYKLTPAQVYTSVTKDLLQFYGNLRPLSISPRVPKLQATQGVPSWALDLNSHRGFWTPWTTDPCLYENSNANRGMPSSLIRYRDGDVLEIEGVIVDTVKTVGYHDRQHIKEPAALLDMVRRWHALATQGSRRHKEFGALMLNNTLRAKDWHDTRPIVETDVDAVSDYLETGMPNHTIDSITASAMFQSFFITESGLMGLGHMETRPGDEIWVFKMGKVPFTLRMPTKSHNSATDHEFFGPCYIQGIMQGEYVEDAKDDIKYLTVKIH